MKQEDKQTNYELAEKLISEQNFTAAVIIGAITTLFAGAIYSIIVTKWDFSYGFVAAGIGIAVGASMQSLGRGIETKFAVLAASYTIAGCILGKVFPAIVRLAREGATSPQEVFQSNGISELAGQFAFDFSFIELVFWLVGVWFAVFLVKRPLSRSERLAIGMHRLKEPHS